MGMKYHKHAMYDVHALVRYCLFDMKHTGRRSFFGRFLHLRVLWKAENQTNSTSALTWSDVVAE